MKETRLDTLFVVLLQTHGQSELLAHLLTGERLRDVQVYQEEQTRLRDTRQQALEEFARWLCRMGLQKEMVRLIQQEHFRRFGCSLQQTVRAQTQGPVKGKGSCSEKQQGGV